MRKLKIAEVILDFDLYPRGNVSSYHVSSFAEALSAGAEFPPIIIDKKSKRVVDGFHRIKAYQKILDENAEIEVIEKSYSNEKELVLDSIRYNSGHGLRMDVHDMAHCAILAEKLKIADVDLAGALNISIDRLGSLKADRTAMGKGGLVPLKRTIAHMHGRHLNKQQITANEKLSGMSQLFYVNQIIILIESDLLDTKNQALIERLYVLSDIIQGMRKRKVA